MKIIVKTETNESLYLFANETYIYADDNKTIIGNPLEYSILDCNNKNTIVYTNVTPPEDWVGCKYLFDGTTWVINPDWKVIV